MARGRRLSSNTEAMNARLGTCIKPFPSPAIFQIPNVDKPALIFPGKTALTISHRSLKQHVEEDQQQLAQLGVASGTVISTCLPNSLEFVVAFLGICKQRGKAVPLNPAYKQGEIEIYAADRLMSLEWRQCRPRLEGERQVRVSDRHET